MSRVFITGLGAITPIGNDAHTYWQNLVAGKSGAGHITSYDTADMPYTIACEVKGFDAAGMMRRATAESAPRVVQLAVAAACEAVEHAQLPIDARNRERVGVFMATGGGGLSVIEDATMTLGQAGWRAIDPFAMPYGLASMVSCQTAIELDAQGPVMTHALACASGSYSILEAYHFLQRGEADAIVAGGSESSITLMTLCAFGRMGAISARTDSPEQASRPFSIDRDGFVAGEGAAAVVLETEEHARARGATCYAEILGGCLTGDGFHITAPDPSAGGAARALRGAIAAAGLPPDAIGAVYAHGTATPLNDEAECRALKLAFGDAAYAMPVTSIKSMIGHGFGAAGAQSMVAAVRTLQEGIIPPTINYTPDPAIDLDIVGNQARRVAARYALVNAFGFGGHNVVVVVGRVET